jgi:hypothetical protein
MEPMSAIVPAGLSFSLNADMNVEISRLANLFSIAFNAAAALLIGL